MEPLEAIDNLARIARQEPTPPTDIPVASVLRAAQNQRQLESRWRLAPLAWSAALSAVAASVILVLALRQSSNNSVDPISPLFNAAQVQMP